MGQRQPERIELVGQIVDCVSCSLWAGCTSPVPFSGPVPAKLAVMTEAPMPEDDEACKPFVSAAGQLVRDELDRAGIDSGKVVYLHAVACHSGERPTPEQVEACRPNRQAQLDVAAPEWTLLMGDVAIKSIWPHLSARCSTRRPFEIAGRRYFTTVHPVQALEHEVQLELLRADLAVLAGLLGQQEWCSAIPDDCSGCGDWASWFEAESGLGWCDAHVPSYERRRFDEWHAKVAEDLSRARSAQRGQQWSEAGERRDLGMAMAETGADDGWMDRAWGHLVRYLRGNAEFFVDDFWATSGLDRPSESRALGPLVNRAARDGLMRKSGEFRKSVASNLTEKPVWASLIYEGPSA